jgi:hypothetical protein
MSTVAHEEPRVAPERRSWVSRLVVVALFAWLATRVVAKYGFGGKEDPR